MRVPDRSSTLKSNCFSPVSWNADKREREIFVTRSYGEVSRGTCTSLAGSTGTWKRWSQYSSSCSCLHKLLLSAHLSDWKLILLPSSSRKREKIKCTSLSDYKFQGHRSASRDKLILLNRKRTLVIIVLSIVRTYRNTRLRAKKRVLIFSAISLEMRADRVITIGDDFLLHKRNCGTEFTPNFFSPVLKKSNSILFTAYRIIGIQKSN